MHCILYLVTKYFHIHTRNFQRKVPEQPGTSSWPEWWLEGLLSSQQMHWWSRSYPDLLTYQNATPKLQKYLQSQTNSIPSIRRHDLYWWKNVELHLDNPFKQQKYGLKQRIETLQSGPLLYSSVHSLAKFKENLQQYMVLRCLTGILVYKLSASW